MANVFTQSADLLATYAQTTPEILVAYSGGKDSMVVLDLCSKAGFRRIVGFFMCTVPGLDYDTKNVNWARDRYGIEVVVQQDFRVMCCMRDGFYCDRYKSCESFPEYSPIDQYNMVMYELGIPVIFTGMKKSDSQARRRTMANMTDNSAIIHPIMDWSKYEVMAYGKLNNLPFPDTNGAATTGVSVKCDAVLWLHDHHPADYERLKRYFRYVPAIVHRHRWYGVGSYRHEDVRRSPTMRKLAERAKKRGKKEST